MKYVMEKWKNFINERAAPPSAYGGSEGTPDWKQFREKLNEMSKHIWIFFDTETTGLKAEEDHVQATQVAAIAYHTHGFNKMPTEVKSGRFNMKLKLEPATTEYMEQEPESYPDGKKTLKDLFKMTQYDHSEEAQVGYSDQPTVSEKFTEYLYKMKEQSPSGQVILIAHNSPYDVGIMNMMYKRGGIEIPPAIVMDSIGIIDTYFKAVMQHIQNKVKYDKNYTKASPEEKQMIQDLTVTNRWGNKYLASQLGILTNVFNIDNENWHEALADVQMTMEVLFNVVQYMDKRGASFGRLKSRYRYRG